MKTTPVIHGLASLLLLCSTNTARAWIEVDTALVAAANTRFEGADGSAYLDNYKISLADVDGNGKDDLLLSETGADPGGTSQAGSLYILFDDHPGRAVGTPGTTLAMSDPTNYSVRIDGAVGGSCLGGLGKYVAVADFTGDGNNDLVVASGNGHGSASCAGAVFLIDGTTFQSSLIQSGTGHLIDLSDTTTWIARWDGDQTDALFGAGLDHGDLDGDGKVDLAVAAPRSDHNGDSHPLGGAVYVLTGSAIQAMTGTGNVRNVALPSDYDLRFDAPHLHLFLGWASVTIADLDANGIDELLMAAGDWTAFTSSGSVYVIRDSLYANHLAAAATQPNVPLEIATNWSLRVRGPSVSGLGVESVATADFDENGLQDLVLGAFSHNPLWSGSVFLVLDHQFSALTGPGDELDLSNASNFNIRFDAEGMENLLGQGESVVADFDHDTRPDIAMAAYWAPFGTVNRAGKVYIVPRRWIGNDLGPGRVVQLSDATIDGVIYGGTETNGYLGFRAIASGDWDGDGGDDLILGGSKVDGPAGTDAGAVYSIVRFAHELTSTLPTTSCGGSLDYVPSDFTLGVTVHATQSTTDIDTAQFLMNDTDPLATWSDCQVGGGNTDPKLLSFNCIVSGLPEGDHTVVARARDDQGTLTTSERYERYRVHVDNADPLLTVTEDPCTQRLQLAASDNAGTVAMMCLSEDPTMANAICRPFAADFDFTFQGCTPGASTTLYVQYYDQANNPSSIASTTVPLS